MFEVKTKHPSVFGPLTEALCLENMRLFKTHGFKSLLASGIRYIRDPPGTNRYKNFLEILSAGGADCKSLVGWLLAELWEYGIPAVPLVTKTRPHLYHVRARLWPNTEQEVIIDPSLLKGMKP